MVDWPIVRWTVYGRWSDCGRYVFSSSPHVAQMLRDEIIYVDLSTDKRVAGTPNG